MSESGSQRQFPKAVIHKQILEVADTNPDASIETIADDISGASPDLVERVLNSYGDPGAEHSASAEPTHASMSEETTDDSLELAREDDPTAPHALEHQGEPDGEASSEDGTPHHPDSTTGAQTEEPDMSTPDTASESIDLAEVSTNQRDVLKAINEQPDATQGELAEQFDVTRATISRWVNEIPGFEWQDRQTFVAHHLDASETVSDGGSQPHEALTQDSPASDPRLDEVEQRLADLQTRIDRLEQDGVDGKPDRSASLNPDQFAKIVRACVADDRITEDEEEAFIAALR